MRHTAWLKVRLDNDELAGNEYLHKSEIVPVLIECGLKVTKRTMVQVKVSMEDDEEGASPQPTMPAEHGTTAKVRQKMPPSQ